jgi:hypothetical protein
LAEHPNWDNSNDFNAGGRWRDDPIAGILWSERRARRNAMAGNDPKSDHMGNPIGGGVAIADLHPHVPYTDLREWLAEAEKLGEVREAKGL